MTDNHQVTVILLDTGEVIATNDIDPDKSHWRKQNKEPGRWPGSPK